MAEVENNDSLRKAGWFAIFAGGILVSLVAYGLLQERIMTETYDGVKFTYTAFLVMCNRLLAVVYALVMMLVFRETAMWQAPLWKYSIVSLSNVAATFCQYEALKYVIFPVQMLGKSFKMMPVMAWGMVISGKSYGLTDWLIAATVTGSVTVFLLTGPITSHDHQTKDNPVFGLLLLLAFLAFDGLTSTMQEKLFKEHEMSKFNQMFYVNGWSAIISVLLLVFQGQLIPVLDFCKKHPPLLTDALSLSVAAVSGQYFIYSLIKEFGALAFAATMNVRQILSIIISYIKFHHSITEWQVVAIFGVFGALFYKSYLGLFVAPAAARKAPKEDTPLMSSAAGSKQPEGKSDGLP